MSFGSANSEDSSEACSRPPGSPADGLNSSGPAAQGRHQREECDHRHQRPRQRDRGRNRRRRHDARHREVRGEDRHDDRQDRRDDQAQDGATERTVDSTPLTRTERGFKEWRESLRQNPELSLTDQNRKKHERRHELDAEHESVRPDVRGADRDETDGPNPSPAQDDGQDDGRDSDPEDGEQRSGPSAVSNRGHIEHGPSDQEGQRHDGRGPQCGRDQLGRGHVPILLRASANGVAGSQSTTCATRRSWEIRLSRSMRKIRRAVWSSGRCSPSLHSMASGDGETIATSYPRASIAMTAFSAARSWSGEIKTMRQSRGKNRVRTQATCANGHSPPGRTWVRWSRIRYNCFRPNAGGTQSRTSRCTIRPTRFFDARTCSAMPSAARTPCSIGLSVSVPMNDSRRASTTITTSPDRSPSYSFVKRRSSRAEAFQLIRRTSSPAAYSRTPQNSVPAPICLEGTCPNHGRVRRGWSFVRRRSSIVGATTRRASIGRTASSAPRASGSRDRTRTGPIRKSPFTRGRTVYDRGTASPRSRDTTAWFEPLMITNSRGSTSTISMRSKVGPSFRTTSFTSTSRPTSARSRESVRTATRRGLAGGKSEPSARTMTGGKARRTTCQLRKARPATKSPRDAAARPLESGVRMSRHLGHGNLPQDVGEDRRGPDAANPWIRLQDDTMGERGHRDRLHIVRGHEVPARDGGPSARHLQEGQGAPRARADIDLAVGPRRRDDVDHVPFDGGLDVDVLDRGLEGADLVGRCHGLDRRVVRPAFSASLEDLDFLLSRRVADVDLQQEPIDLGFRERIGALVLDRILRRDHEEGPVQRERLALQRRLAFLHRLEERGLGLRRGAVDLVRQEDVREDRAASEDEVAGLAVEHVRPRDVRRQQVRRELDAAEREAEARREAFRDQCLRQPGDVFDQQVAVSEDRPEDALEHRALADDHGLDRVEEVAADLPDRRDVHRHASIRVRTSRNSRTKPPRERARWTHANRSSRSPASR